MASVELSEIEYFKECVYKKIHSIQSFKKNSFEDVKTERNSGLFFKIFVKGLMELANKRWLEYEEYDKHLTIAEKALKSSLVKNKLCNVLDEAESLPIEIAYQIIPVLIDLPSEEKKKLAINATSCALMAIKLSEMGIENFCEKDFQSIDVIQ